MVVVVVALVVPGMEGVVKAMVAVVEVVATVADGPSPVPLFF